jgi:hypothetical protein
MLKSGGSTPMIVVAWPPATMVEPAGPEPVTQDGDPGRAGSIVVGSEQPAAGGLHPDQPEEVPRRTGRADLLRLSAPRDGCRERHDGANPVEQRVHLLHLDELGPGHPVLR